LRGGPLVIGEGFFSGLGLIVRGALIQQPTAELALAGGTLQFQNTSEHRLDGIVSGTGTISFPTEGLFDQLALLGEFRPGNPTGTLVMPSGRLGLRATTLTTFTLSPSGTAEFQGRHRLDGRLRLVVLPETPLVAGTTWRLFRGQRTETFDALEVIGLPAGFEIQLEYLADGVEARLVSTGATR